MKKSHHITDKLLAGLGRAKLPAAAPQAQPAPKGEKVTRLGIALSESDLARIEEVKVFCATRKVFISSAVVVKAALRLLPLNDDLINLLPEVKPARRKPQ